MAKPFRMNLIKFNILFRQPCDGVLWRTGFFGALCRACDAAIDEKSFCLRMYALKGKRPLRAGPVARDTHKKKKCEWNEASEVDNDTTVLRERMRNFSNDYKTTS